MTGTRQFGNNRMDKKRLFISLLIAAILSFIIYFVSNDFGITWDEPIYIRNGDRYVSWVLHPDWKSKDSTFQAANGDIHPPLRKLLGGLTHEIFTNRLRLIDNTRGYRISSLLFVFPFILTFTYIAIGQFGYAVGILMPFIFSLLPHVLFLTPLFTLDYAVTALWFMAVVFAMKGMKNYLWLTLSAVFVGASLLTKIHGYLIFVPIGGFWIWHFRKILAARRLNDKLWNAIIRILYIITLAFALYIALWPWLWTSTIPHLTAYLSLQITHNSVPVFILGHPYQTAPWWYSFVMLFVTTPVLIIIFLIIGSIYSVRKGSLWDRVILLNAFYPLLIFSLPVIARYDWIRLFLPAYPFICLLAGKGIAVTISWLRPGIRVLGVIVVVALWIMTVYSSVIRIHPWESAYYNEFVGGIAGASRLGFESEYWGNAYIGVLSWMNMHKQTMMCVWPDLQPFSYYQAMGQLQAGVVFDATGDACKYIVVLMRQGYFPQDAYVRKIVATQKPVYTVSVDGVTLVGVYDKSTIRN